MQQARPKLQQNSIKPAKIEYARGMIAGANAVAKKSFDQFVLPSFLFGLYACQDYQLDQGAAAAPPNTIPPNTIPPNTIPPTTTPEDTPSTGLGGEYYKSTCDKFLGYLCLEDKGDVPKEGSSSSNIGIIHVSSQNIIGATDSANLLMKTHGTYIYHRSMSYGLINHQNTITLPKYYVEVDLGMTLPNGFLSETPVKHLWGNYKKSRNVEERFFDMPFPDAVALVEGMNVSIMISPDSEGRPQHYSVDCVTIDNNEVLPEYRFYIDVASNQKLIMSRSPLRDTVNLYGYNNEAKEDAFTIISINNDNNYSGSQVFFDFSDSDSDGASDSDSTSDDDSASGGFNVANSLLLDAVSAGDGVSILLIAEGDPADNKFALLVYDQQGGSLKLYDVPPQNWEDDYDVFGLHGLGILRQDKFLLQVGKTWVAFKLGEDMSVTFDDNELDFLAFPRLQASADSKHNVSFIELIPGPSSHPDGDVLIIGELEGNQHSIHLYAGYKMGQIPQHHFQINATALPSLYDLSYNFVRLAGTAGENYSVIATLATAAQGGLEAEVLLINQDTLEKGGVIDPFAEHAYNAAIIDGLVSYSDIF